MGQTVDLWFYLLDNEPVRAAGQLFLGFFSLDFPLPEGGHVEEEA